MRKLEKFIEKNHNDCEVLNNKSLAKVNGSISAPTSRCGSYEVTCLNNCQDNVWVHYTDGVETWRNAVVSENDCP